MKRAVNPGDPAKGAIEFNHDNTIVRRVGAQLIAFHFELHSDAAGRLEWEIIDETAGRRT